MSIVHYEPRTCCSSALIAVFSSLSCSASLITLAASFVTPFSPKNYIVEIRRTLLIFDRDRAKRTCCFCDKSKLLRFSLRSPWVAIARSNEDRDVTSSQKVRKFCGSCTSSRGSCLGMIQFLCAGHEQYHPQCQAQEQAQYAGSHVV